jgi:hypothetical protein
VPDDVRRKVAGATGVAETGALAHVRLPVKRSGGQTELVSLLAADHRPRSVGSDLGDGAAIDDALVARGVRAGALLAVDETKVEVVRTAGRVGLGLGGSAWVELERWREIVSEARPDLAPSAAFMIRPDFTRVPDAWPALTVRVADGADITEVADAIDESTGTTETLTVAEAIDAIPGAQRERRVFSGLITVTVVVVWVVVALFLGLVTLERMSLLSALRAIGVRDAGLVAGLVVQAAIVVLGALVLAGMLVAAAMPLLPPMVPVLLLPARMISAAGGLLAAAVLGALGSARRAVRADPASAMS